MNLAGMIREERFVMKTEMSGRLDYELESRAEENLQTSLTGGSADPVALQLAAQQDERRRIAQELHDTLLRGFTGIALKLDALTTSLPPALSKTKQQLLR